MNPPEVPFTDSKGCLSINMVDVRRAEASAMEDGRESKQQLLERIRVLEMENRTLQAMVERKATNAASEKTTDVDGRNHKVQPSLEDDERGRSTCQNMMELSMGARDIERFSRQLLLPSFGVEKQKRLRSSSALVVGAGGLGCPAAMYLSACGIGKLGIADKDEVELTNLHRQIAHTEQRIGWHKAHSASETCVGLNSGLQVEVFAQGIHSKNAVDIVEQFDVILDCSDNPSTRYLISDACVVTNRPLVSGAAIGLDGQLTVYHHGADGPCYRCLFPESPKPEACQRCSDAGVLGVVPGIVGSLQALEAIKLLTGLGEPLSRKLLIFNAASLSFTRVKLRERSMSCFACGTESKLDKGFLASYDYEAFTGAPSNDKITRNLQLLEQEERVSASEYNRKRRRSKHELWDVRPPHEFAIASLPWSKNVPMDAVKDAGQEVLDQDPDRAIYVLCRRGNDSQIAVETLKKLGMSTCYDIVEGLDGWRKEVDGGFPLY